MDIKWNDLIAVMAFITFIYVIFFWIDMHSEKKNYKKKQDKGHINKMRFPKLIIFIFFPITLYIFVGISSFFLMSKLEAITEKLLKYSSFPKLKDFNSIDLHKKMPTFGVLFSPIISFGFAIIEIVIFTVAAILAIIVYMREVIEFILKWIRGDG